MNAGFSANTTSIEGRIILTAENQTGRGFAEALRDLQRYTTQAQRMQTEYVRGQRLQHRQHEQAQRDIQKTQNMAGAMFASFVTGVTAAAASVGIVMGNMAQAYREEVKNMAVWNERLKANTKLSAASLDRMAKDIADFSRLPSTWDARRVMTATTRGAGDNAALIRRRTEAVIDLQTLLGGSGDILGTLEQMRTGRGPMGATKLLGAINPDLYKGYRSREWAQQRYERAFEESPEKAYNMLLAELIREAEKKFGTAGGFTRRTNETAEQENRRLRLQDDITERGGKEINELREALLKVVNDMTAKFIPFYDSLSETNKQLVVFGVALGGLATLTFGYTRILRGLLAMAGLGGGGGPRVPGGPRGPRVPSGPRVPLGVGKLLGWVGLGLTAAELIQMEAERLGGRDASVPLTGEENRRAFDIDRGPVRRAPSDSNRVQDWSGRGHARYSGGGGFQRTPSTRVRPPSNIPGFLLPGYGSAFEGDPLATFGGYNGAGMGMNGTSMSGVAVEAARPLGSSNLSLFSVTVDRATRGVREFNDALSLATMSLWGIRRRGGTGGRGGGVGAGGVTGGTAGVGAPGGYPSMAPGGVGMSGGLNTGGGTGFGQYGAPGSEYGGATGGEMATATGSFNEIAPRLMGDLQKDLGLTKEQAAGVVGNLAHESAGFTTMQEVNPRGGGRGGLGWAQWTGPRRKQFEEYARQHGLSTSSYEANYGFLKQELGGSESAALAKLKQAGTAQEAMYAFEGGYERAGVKAYGKRMGYTNLAMGGAGAGGATAGVGAPGGAPSAAGTPIGAGQVGAYQRALQLNGMNENQQRALISQYLASGGQALDPATSAWCAAFVGSSLQQSGIQGTGSNVATSYGDWGVGVDPQNVAAGDVLVQMKGQKVGSTGGHVGFATGETRMVDGQMQFRMYGGNQGDAAGYQWVSGNDLRIRRAQAGAGAVGGAPSVGATGPVGQMGAPPPFGVGKAVKSHPSLPLHNRHTEDRLTRDRTARNGYIKQRPVPVPKGGTAGGNTALSGKAVTPPQSPALLEDRATRERTAFGGNLPRARPVIPGAQAPATTGSVIRGGIVSGGGLLNVTRNQDRSAMDFMGGGGGLSNLFGGGGGGRNPLEGLGQMASVQLGRGAVDITVKLAKQLQAAVPSVLPASHFDLGINVDRTGTNFSRPGDPAFPPTLSP